MHLEHPYSELAGGQWLRGNLHAHTTNSDGGRATQAVIDDYASRGYGFLMISDHDIYTSCEELSQYNAGDLILIPGNEVSAHGPHMLHVYADRLVKADPLRQQVINDITASQGFCVVNHPNWQNTFDHCPTTSMQQWIGYAGLEIFNGVIGRLEGSPYATNKWDMLLSAGRRLWGFANDDSHAATGDVALGWNTAYITEPNVGGVNEALEQGRFYASTGVTIESIVVEGMSIRIETANARRIVALTNQGQRVAMTDANGIELDASNQVHRHYQPHTYVRFECWGDGESFAWTQPFFVVL